MAQSPAAVGSRWLDTLIRISWRFATITMIIFFVRQAKLVLPIATKEQIFSDFKKAFKGKSDEVEFSSSEEEDSDEFDEGKWEEQNRVKRILN